MNSTTCSCSTGLLRFLLLLRKKKMKKRYITVIRFSILDFQPFSCNRASGMFIVTKHKSLTLPDSAFSFRKSLNKKLFLCFSAYSLSIRGTPFFVRLILCRKLFKRLSQLQVFFIGRKKKHFFFRKSIFKQIVRSILFLVTRKSHSKKLLYLYFKFQENL